MGIDAKPPLEAAAILLDAQRDAAASVGPALSNIVSASSIAIKTLQGRGRLVYAGAGSSGLIAMMDALELPGTYGISRDQIVVLMAGGAAICQDLQGGPEDDVDLAWRDAAQAQLSAEDCVIVVAASGSTPYTCKIAEEAKRAGAKLVAVANNAGTRIFNGADVSIVLETPPEVISGSTRMGAGTAQKIALNMFSTLTGIGLGHVHDGHMVNLRADNAKLRGRASRIVSAITGLPEDEAGAWLDKADGSAKLAVLLAEGAASVADAQENLAVNGGSLRRARHERTGAAS
ncbi:MAG: N-acetylmuramic acid 6-phosphate etherase [Stappiaceae bacterium]